MAPRSRGGEGRRAREGARDDAHARERYVALRAADLDDRGRQLAAFVRAAEAAQATPEWEVGHCDACGEAVRGTAILTGL